MADIKEALGDINTWWKRKFELFYKESDEKTIFVLPAYKFLLK